MSILGPVFTGNFGGIRVIPSKIVAKQELVQFRFPRSKKKRLRKKWAARRENWRVKDIPTGYWLDQNTIACSESFYAQLKESLLLQEGAGVSPEMERILKGFGL